MSTPQAGKIYGAICEIMKAVDAIAKGRRNAQQGYQFRGIDDVYNAMHGPLAEHGVFIVPQVLDREMREQPSKSGGVLFYTTLKVAHRFYAADGSYVEAITCGEAMDSGDKSTNKAMSAAMKYAILEVFAMPTEGDNDTENHSPEPVSRGNAPQTPPQRPAMPKATTPPLVSKTPPKAQETPKKGNSEPDPLEMVVEEVIKGLESKDKQGKPFKNQAGQMMPGKPFTQWGYPSDVAKCTLTTIREDVGNELAIAQEDEQPRRVTYTPNQYGGNITKVERI